MAAFPLKMGKVKPHRCLPPPFHSLMVLLEVLLGLWEDPHNLAWRLQTQWEVPLAVWVLGSRA